MLLRLQAYFEECDNRTHPTKIKLEWRVTKKLCLVSYKVRQVQTVEEGDYQRRCIFVTGCCGCTWQCIFADEGWFHLSGFISVRNNRHSGSNDLQDLHRLNSHFKMVRH
jgi:hypothetical protein